MTTDSVSIVPPESHPMGFFFKYSIEPEFWLWVLIAWLLLIGGLVLLTHGAFAQGTLPGSDASDKLEAAGTLLRLVDTALFKWSARVFAGVCMFSAAWSLKEQRIGIAVICIVGAVIFATAPAWVRNLFAISGGDSIFTN